ncbi:MULTISPECIES: hypothetical protein [unclassified Helicobacter]|uniref:hypothetical protein n=1 Tax=unclassified Helicobacter TaxID=2593540 RepID=UPI000CF16C15|nr:MULTISPECIES: hypothetical protein [unclassified Helicobacter]
MKKLYKILFVYCSFVAYVDANELKNVGKKGTLDKNLHYIALSDTDMMRLSDPYIRNPDSLKSSNTTKESIDSNTSKNMDKTLEDVILNEGGKKIDTVVDLVTQQADQEVDLRDSKNKSGFMLGTQLILKKLEISQVISGFQELMSTTPSLNAGLILGYQFYFSKRFGFRLSGLIDAGSPATLKATKLKAIELTPAQTPGTGGGITAAKITPIEEVYQKYWPIKGSIELSLLLDFVATQKHVFGGLIGGGYELEWSVPVKGNAIVGENNTSALSKLVQKPQGVITSGLYPIVGLYYYYKKHQIGVNYRFAEYYLVSENNTRWDFDTGNGSLKTTTKFRPKQSITLYYIYRF